MKKIERINIYKAAENNKAVVDDTMVMVKESDLDELEQENKLFYENWQAFVAIANEQRIARVAIRQQRDDAIEALIELSRFPLTEDDKFTNKHYKGICEKITGQTWEEIKEGKRC